MGGQKYLPILFSTVLENNFMNLKIE